MKTLGYRCCVQLHLVLVKQLFLSWGLRVEVTQADVNKLSSFGQHVTLAKHLDELSTNQSETHGLHFSENTQGFTNYRHRGLAKCDSGFAKPKVFEEVLK